MLSIYSNTNEDGEKRCGYFDPTTTYGGPQIDTPVSYFLEHVQQMVCSVTPYTIKYP